MNPGDRLPTSGGSAASLRLHRVPTLRAFRQTLIDLMPLDDVGQARAMAVIVPTRSAAALLQRTIEDRLEPGEAVVLPDLLTRRDGTSGWRVARPCRRDGSGPTSATS